MDDRSFLERFESASISREAWTHECHLRMAYLYLRSLAFDEALGRIRDGIRKLNAANEVPETLRSGYHETLTVAWARLVAEAIRATPSTPDFGAFLVLHARLCEKSLLLEYYSDPLIFSARARQSWVEPDLASLPVGLDPR